MSIALETKVKELEARVRSLEEASAILSRSLETTISDDALIAAYTLKFKEPPHHRMKRETIEAKLRE